MSKRKLNALWKLHVEAEKEKNVNDAMKEQHTYKQKHGARGTVTKTHTP